MLGVVDDPSTKLRNIFFEVRGGYLKISGGLLVSTSHNLIYLEASSTDFSSTGFSEVSSAFFSSSIIYFTSLQNLNYKLSLFLIKCSSWLGSFIRFTSIHESYLPFLIKVVFSDSKISLSSQKNLLLKSIASVLSTRKLVGLICLNRLTDSSGKNFER